VDLFGTECAKIRENWHKRMIEMAASHSGSTVIMVVVGR
jgi:hypothetical protein